MGKTPSPDLGEGWGGVIFKPHSTTNPPPPNLPLTRGRGTTHRKVGISKKINKNELLLIGSMLYWGEGGKTHHGMARVSNCDPAIIKVMMRFFREICHVPEEKFRAYIHTYSHLSASEAEQYWSKVTSIPRRQFYKTYVKASVSSQGKRDKLPYGTLDITICDTKLFLTIMGWIERVKQLLIEEVKRIDVPQSRASARYGYENYS